MGRLKSSNYEYEDEIEYVLSIERKEELIEKVNKMISKKNSVALYKILDISKNEEECEFLFEYLEERGILIRGINTSLAGELQNYEHLPKDGQSYLPPALSHEETIKLFETKVNGTEEEKSEARSRLIEHNLRLVYWIIGTNSWLRKLGVEKDDLISFGSEALIKAVDKYDPTREAKFSTYAVPKIYWEIRNQIVRQPRLIKITPYMVEAIKKVKEIKEILYEEKARSGIDDVVTADEIAKVMGTNERRVEEFLMMNQILDLESLEEILSDDYNQRLDGYLGDEDVTLVSGYDITGNNSRAYGKNNSATKEDVDIIEDGVLLDGGEPDSFAGEDDELDTIVYSMQAKEKIEEALKDLSPREEEVIRYKFGMIDGEEWSLERISKIYKVKKATIHQVKNKGIRKIEGKIKLSDFGWKKYSYWDEKRSEVPPNIIDVSDFERPKQEEKQTRFSGDMARRDVSTSDVLLRIKEVLEQEQDIEKVKVFVLRALDCASRTDYKEREYLLRYIYHFIQYNEKPSFVRKDENDEKLVRGCAKSKHAKEVYETEKYFIASADIILRNETFKLVNGREPLKEHEIEEKLATEMENFRESVYDARWKRKFERDIGILFYRKYGEYKIKQNLEYDKTGIKMAKNSARFYIHNTYNFNDLAINAWIDFKAKYDNQELENPELLPEEKVLFDELLQTIAEQNQKAKQKELGEEVLLLFGNIKDTYQSLEERLNRKRELELQLRNMQAELSKEKEKLIEYISKLKTLIETNKSMLEKLVQLESVLEAIRRAEERLIEIEKEEVEYQNQINEIIKEREASEREKDINETANSNDTNEMIAKKKNDEVDM